MLLSESEMKSGILPGPRLPPMPGLVRDPRARALRKLNHWRRFQLGDIETVTVTPPIDISTGLPSTTYTPPPPLPDFITPTVPDIAPPVIDILPPAAIVAPSLPSPPVSVAPSTDWFGDLTKLAQVAGQTAVGIIAAQHGLPPGVTGGGISPGPGVVPGMSAAQLAALTPAQRAQYAAMYPGTSPSGGDMLSSLLGGSSMTTMLLISGLGLVAVLMLARK